MPQISKISEFSVLLVQIRDHGPVREEEVDSFLRHGGLHRDQMQVLNVFDTPVFEPTVVDDYDVVLVGGASEASVLQPDVYPFVPQIVAMFQHCIDQEIPVFASCFGFQAAVVGLGGEVIRDEMDFEMGTIPLGLSKAAYADPVFCDTPDGFLAVSCHQERTLQAPEGCVALATTPQCLHAFRVIGKPFWAFQFHPELDRDCFVQRLGVFRSKYTESDAAYEGIAMRFQETPESNALLRRFLSHVAAGL